MSFCPSLNYGFVAELNLLTDRKHPSEAAHQLTLKVGEKTDVLTFPCPFNATEIHTSSSESDSNVQLVVMKAINEPHPEEWLENHSVLRWQISALAEWDPERLMQDLNYHLSAQFVFADLKRQILEGDADQSTTVERGSGLRGVREVIRTIFQSTVLDGNRCALLSSNTLPRVCFYL